MLFLRISSVYCLREPSCCALCTSYPGAPFIARSRPHWTISVSVSRFHPVTSRTPHGRLAASTRSAGNLESAEVNADADQSNLLPEELPVRRGSGIELGEDAPAARGRVRAGGAVILQPRPRADRRVPVLFLRGLDVRRRHEPESA